MASLKHLDKPIPEQVIEVPEIASSSRLSCKVLRAPQMTEQLVEVSTVVSRSSSRLPSRLLTFQFRVVVGWGGGLQGFSPSQNSTAPVSQQVVDTPVRFGGLPGSRPGQGPTASSSTHLHDDADKGIRRFFFALFPELIKIPRSGRQVTARGTPAACEATECLRVPSSSSTSSTTTSGVRASGFRLGVATLGGSSMTRMVT